MCVCLFGLLTHSGSYWHWFNARPLRGYCKTMRTRWLTSAQETTISSAAFHGRRPDSPRARDGWVTFLGFRVFLFWDVVCLARDKKVVFFVHSVLPAVWTRLLSDAFSIRSHGFGWIFCVYFHIVSITPPFPISWVFGFSVEARCFKVKQYVTRMEEKHPKYVQEIYICRNMFAALWSIVTDIGRTSIL